MKTSRLKNKHFWFILFTFNQFFVLFLHFYNFNGHTWNRQRLRNHWKTNSTDTSFQIWSQNQTESWRQERWLSYRLKKYLKIRYINVYQFILAFFNLSENNSVLYMILNGWTIVTRERYVHVIFRVYIMGYNR